MSDSKFDILKFILILVIGVINAFGVTCILCSLFLNLDDLDSTDAMYALPLMKEPLPFSQDFLNNFFNYLADHYTVVLVLGGAIMLISLVSYILLFRKQSLLFKKNMVIAFFVILIPMMYLVLKELNCLEYILYNYLMDMNRFHLFEVTFLTFLYPTIIILSFAYILFTDGNKAVILILSVLMALGTFSPYYLFVKDIEAKANLNDYKKPLAEVADFDLNKKPEKRVLSFIYSDGKAKPQTFVSEIRGIPLTKANWEDLHKYSQDNPYSALDIDIIFFAQNYFLSQFHLKGYKTFLVERYLNNYNRPNALNLIKAISYTSDVSGIVDEIEKAYLDRNNVIARIAYGFMAANFEKAKMPQKAQTYWKKYDDLKVKTYMEIKLTPLIDQIRSGKTKPVTFSGQLKMYNKPLAGASVLLMDFDYANKLLFSNKDEKVSYSDNFITNIFDDTVTAEDGSFQLTTWCCMPVALAVSDKITYALSDKDLSILKDYKCDQQDINLGTINLMP